MRHRKLINNRRKRTVGLIKNRSNRFQFILGPLLICRYISRCDKGHRKLIRAMERIHAAKSYAFARPLISRNAGVRTVSVLQSSTHRFNLIPRSFWRHFRGEEFGMQIEFHWVCRISFVQWRNTPSLVRINTKLSKVFDILNCMGNFRIGKYLRRNPGKVIILVIYIFYKKWRNLQNNILGISIGTFISNVEYFLYFINLN